MPSLLPPGWTPRIFPPDPCTANAVVVRMSDPSANGPTPFDAALERLATEMRAVRRFAEGDVESPRAALERLNFPMHLLPQDAADDFLQAILDAIQNANANTNANPPPPPDPAFGNQAGQSVQGMSDQFRASRGKAVRPGVVNRLLAASPLGRSVLKAKASAVSKFADPPAAPVSPRVVRCLSSSPVGRAALKANGIRPVAG
jgi:hypothetical protein